MTRPRHPPARPDDPSRHRAGTDPPAGPGNDGRVGWVTAKGRWQCACLWSTASLHACWWSWAGKNRVCFLPGHGLFYGAEEGGAAAAHRQAGRGKEIDLLVRGLLQRTGAIQYLDAAAGTFSRTYRPRIANCCRGARSKKSGIGGTPARSPRAGHLSRSRLAAGTAGLPKGLRDNWMQPIP